MHTPQLLVLQTKWTQVQASEEAVCARGMVTAPHADLSSQLLDLIAVHLHNPAFASIVLSAQPVCGKPVLCADRSHVDRHPEDHLTTEDSCHDTATTAEVMTES